MLILTRLFGTMHREMVALVRDEMEEIRRLSAEMQALRAESTPTRAVPLAKLLPGADAPRDPAEVHLIVSERLAAFERERYGRWNKISKVLGIIPR